MILCAGRSESFSFATSIGVGLIESASNLTQLICKEKPSFLFFVGTAGSYGKYKPFDSVYSHKAANIELGFLDNHCYTPLDSFIEVTPLKVSRETSMLSPIVNSSNYITTNPELAQKMLLQNIELENMEFFSVLTVAKIFNLPCAGFFVVTNYCNENAHRDFMHNHAKAKELITLHVEKNMKL